MIKIDRIEYNWWHGKDYTNYDYTSAKHYLFLFVKTKAVFILSGSETVTEPNTVILFGVGDHHVYRACGDEYINDWIAFDSDEEMRIPTNEPICLGEAVDISGYIKLAQDAYLRGHEIVCSTILSAMFSEIGTIIAKERDSGVPHADKLLPLRYDLYAHPEKDWSIKSMAERIYISEAYFQKLYKSMFGISCGADILNARIRYSMTLLASTRKSVTEIACQCGFNSPAHFSRQFRMAVGFSPSEYRSRKMEVVSGKGAI